MKGFLQTIIAQSLQIETGLSADLPPCQWRCAFKKMGRFTRDTSAKNISAETQSRNGASPEVKRYFRKKKVVIAGHHGMA
jgi:hypothetical protein